MAKIYKKGPSSCFYLLLEAKSNVSLIEEIVLKFRDEGYHIHSCIRFYPNNPNKLNLKQIGLIYNNYYLVWRSNLLSIEYSPYYTKLDKENFLKQFKFNEESLHEVW